MRSWFVVLIGGRVQRREGLDERRTVRFECTGATSRSARMVSTPITRTMIETMPTVVRGEEDSSMTMSSLRVAASTPVAPTAVRTNTIDTIKETVSASSARAVPSVSPARGDFGARVFHSDL